MKIRSISWMAAVTIAGLTCLLPGRAADAADPGKKPAPAAPSAPGAPGAPESRERTRARMMDRMQMMSERLKLTDEQKEKLRPILQEEAQKLRELRDKEMTPDARRAAAQEMRQGTQKRIKDSNILTPDQLKEWTAMQEQMRSRAQERGAGGGAGKPPKPAGDKTK